MRPIDADKILEAHKFETKLIGKDWTIDDLAAVIESAPTLDVIPIVHGQWINIPDKPEWDQKMCSICGDYFCCQGNYCPNCGAKMDKEK